MINHLRKLTAVALLVIFGLFAYSPLLTYSVAADTNQIIVGEEQEVTKETVVYVTKTGHKYHRVGCRYLKRSCIPMDLKEASKVFAPCKVCNPPSE